VTDWTTLNLEGKPARSGVLIALIGSAIVLIIFAIVRCSALNSSSTQNALSAKPGIHFRFSDSQSSENLAGYVSQQGLSW
jgi:flagellar basal body-associated protein FliL